MFGPLLFVAQWVASLDPACYIDAGTLGARLARRGHAMPTEMQRCSEVPKRSPQASVRVQTQTANVGKIMKDMKDYKETPGDLDVELPF